MFRFTLRDVLWLMVVVGLACLPSRLALQLSTLQTSVSELRTSTKELNAKTAVQRQEIHDLKERELAIIRAVEKKYDDRIDQWSLWPDPDHPSQWIAELESER